MRAAILVLSSSILSGCGSSQEDSADEDVRSIDVEIREVSVTPDCTEDASEDRRSVNVVVRYVNASREPAEFELISARLSYTGAESTTFQLDPPTSGALGPGDVLDLSHRNRIGTATGPSPCGMCDDEAELVIQFGTPSGVLERSVDTVVSCAD